MFDGNSLRPLSSGAFLIGALMSASVAGARQEAANSFELIAGDWDGGGEIIGATGFARAHTLPRKVLAVGGRRRHVPVDRLCAPRLSCRH